MKALYILDTKVVSNTGVVKKVAECTSTWEKYDITTYLLEYPNGAIYDSNLNKITGPVIEAEDAKSRIGWFSVFNKRAIGLKNALTFIDPDILYLRETIWTPRFWIYTRKIKYIVEINSIAVNEIRKRSILAALYWRFNQYMLLKYSAGIVYVTHEIFKNLVYKTKYSTLITNGIDIRELNEGDIGLRKYERKPSVLFVGSPGQIWHGLDKIIHFANCHEEFEFNIAGIGGEDTGNIKYHGYVDTKYLDELSSKSHLGISTLSLYEKGMNEACPLKSRYYLERGLPVIMGYKDPDIENEYEFICRIGNYDGNVNDNEKLITEFIWKCFNNIDLQIQARRFAEKYLSTTKKEKSRIQFLYKVLNEEK